MKLVGESNRVKAIDRYKRKVADEARAKPGRSVLEILDNIPDCLRYTYCAERTDYVRRCEHVCGQYEDRGFRRVVQRNWWDRPYYKGITTHWRAPDADRMLLEIQFHTVESLEARMLTDRAYVKQRDPRTTAEEQALLLDYVSEIADAVPIPYGVDEVPSFRIREAGR